MIKLKDNSIIKGLFKSKRNKVIFIVILVALLLLTLFLSNKKVDNVIEGENANYQTLMENKLSDILSSVEGAGKVKVIISLKSGMETVLATEKTTTETKDGFITVEKPIIVNGKTIITKELYPEVNGVIIVSKGAKNIVVYNKLQQATISLFNIKASQIEILTMK
ncbi:MAG: hypothetical protein J6Q32_00360 [Clostridia bacterium]|nr:hypothetical protein [Clostridia bacterium]